MRLEKIDLYEVFLLRPDAFSVWNDPDVSERLSWYRSVMTNEKPAKFLIVKRIESPINPYEVNDYDYLWKIHDKLSEEFKTIWKKIKEGKLSLEEIPVPKHSFLDIKIVLAKKNLEKCRLCEWRCGAERIKGVPGVCMMDKECIVHTYFHHMGEEAPLVPSGTIFYGGCNFKCVFCIDEDDYILAKINDIIDVKKVKDLVEHFRNGDKVEVLTLRGWRRIKEIIGRTSNVIYEIITNRGKKVRLTPEHIVIVRDDNNNLVEKYAKDIAVGDKLVTLPINYDSQLNIDTILTAKIETINLIEEIERRLDIKLKERIRVKNVTPVLRALRKKYNTTYKELMTDAGVEKFHYGWLYCDSYPFLEFIKLYKKYKEIRNNIYRYLISMKKGVKHYLPAIIKLEPCFMRLLGYFIAEGNYLGEKGLVFTTSDKLMQKDIVNCIRTLITGANSSNLIYKYGDKVSQIIISSKLLYILFRYILGINRKSYKKNFPWIIFHVRKELLREFLSAYLTGDGILAIGEKRTLCVRFVTTSEKIVYQLSYLLGIHGIQYRIRERRPPRKYLLPTGHKSKRKQYWIDVNGSINVSRLMEIAMFFDDRKQNRIIDFLSSVRKAKIRIKGDVVNKINIIRSRKKVYDVVLDSNTTDMEDHVFFAGNGILIHNCQNYDISQLYPRDGVKVTPKELAEIQKKLRLTGARNINHVGGEPTPHIPFIIESLKYLDVNVPQLWNSNMYLSLESMKLIKDLIDIWLPDFKYGNNECAFRYSKIRRYWEVVTRNLKIAYENGDMIIRHLVLPNHIECCTRKILEWIAKNTPKALVNIMDQYRPEHIVASHPEKYPEIARRLKREEIEKAYSIAEELGLVYKPVS